jgi:hypothetical protein
MEDVEYSLEYSRTDSKVVHYTHNFVARRATQLSN